MKVPAIAGLSVLPCLAAQADHWQGHEQWQRKLWGTYTPGPTPSILSPDEGKPRDRALPIITIDPSTGQAHPGVAIVPDYCGEDDDR
jgi:hypothetical protein